MPMLKSRVDIRESRRIRKRSIDYKRTSRLVILIQAHARIEAHIEEGRFGLGCGRQKPSTGIK